MLGVWDWPRLIQKAAQYNYLFQCCHTKLTVSFRKSHSKLKINSAGYFRRQSSIWSFYFHWFHRSLFYLLETDRPPAWAKLALRRQIPLSDFISNLWHDFSVLVVAQAKWSADSHGIKSVFVPFEDQETFDDVLCIQSRSVIVTHETRF